MTSKCNAGQDSCFELAQNAWCILTKSWDPPLGIGQFMGTYRPMFLLIAAPIRSPRSIGYVRNLSDVKRGRIERALIAGCNK